MTPKARKTIQVDDNQLAIIKQYRNEVAKDLGVGVSLADALIVAVNLGLTSLKRKRARK